MRPAVRSALRWIARDSRSASPAASARANNSSGLSAPFPARQRLDPATWPLAGSICGWKRSSIRSRPMRLLERAVARRQGGRRNLAIRHPLAPEPWPFKPTYAFGRTYRLARRPNQGASPARARFGTVALFPQIRILAGVNVARPSPATPERDLAAHGIGLVASPGEAAKSAEAMLRRRYSWAEEDEAETLVALGGDGFMLQTLHAMLEHGESASGVRHEPRHLRLPDERMAAGPAVRADRKRQAYPRRAAGDGSDHHPRRDLDATPRSTKCRCCARPARRPRSKSASTAGW